MKKEKKRNDVLEEAVAMRQSDEDLETVSGGTCPPCQTVRPQSGEALETVSSGRWLEVSYAFGKKSDPDDSDEKK